MNVTPSNPPRSGIRIALLGTLLSWTALLTYFKIVPQWPVLRDSGHLNVAFAALGVLVGAIGMVRSLRAKRRRVVGGVLLVLAAGATGLLAFYIYVLSYSLPTTDDVLAVGQRAPDFELRDQDGRARTLGELAGKRVGLVFFRGHW